MDFPQKPYVGSTVQKIRIFQEAYKLLEVDIKAPSETVYSLCYCLNLAIVNTGYNGQVNMTELEELMKYKPNRKIKKFGFWFPMHSWRPRREILTNILKDLKLKYEREINNDTNSKWYRITSKGFRTT